MSNHQYPVSIRPATEAEVSAAIERSIREAFQGTGLPTCLIGTRNLSGGMNVQPVIKLVSAPVAAPVIKGFEDNPEGEIMIPKDDVILEDADGDLYEVVGFITNGSTTNVRVRNIDGETCDISEDEWADTFGDFGELEIMGAFDRAFVGGLVGKVLANA